jgi:hypothetical protein
MVPYRYTSVRLKDGKWDVVSADTGLEVFGVTYEDVSADFPKERAKTALGTFLDDGEMVAGFTGANDQCIQKAQRHSMYFNLVC